MGYTCAISESPIHKSEVDNPPTIIIKLYSIQTTNLSHFAGIIGLFPRELNLYTNEIKNL